MLYRKAANIFKICITQKLTVASNEKPFGDHTKGFFSFFDPRITITRLTLIGGGMRC
jgi:hypothetical protein